MILPRRVVRCDPVRAAVAIWSIGRLDPAVVAASRRLVTDDELDLMGRGRDEEARDRRIVTRAALRWLVADRIDVDDASSIVLGQGQHGKPWLSTGPSGDRSVEFNVTHTRGLSLIAVSEGVPVGVDAERRERALELELANRICTRSERRRVVRLARVDEASARELLRVYWVRKEAVAKEEGLGLRLDVSRVGIHGAPRVRGSGAGVPADVTVHDLDVGTDHVGAVAWAGRAEIVGAVREWTPG